jgi:hypothetical protein
MAHHKKTYENRVGMRFGLLTIRSQIKTLTNKTIVVICDCDCGGEKRVNFGELTKGNVKDCGCQKNKPVKDATKEVKKYLAESGVEPGYLLLPKKRKKSQTEIGLEEARVYLYSQGNGGLRE